MSTPHLWRCIDIRLSTARESEGYVDLQHRWLERARNTPLCVYLYDDSDCFLPTGIPDPDASLVPLMQAIGRSSRQWQHISIDVTDRLLMDALFSTVHNDFPLLEFLTLDFKVDPSLPGAVDSDAEFPISFLNAPRLHQILVFKYRSMLAPWAQITWFSSSHIPLPSVYDILNRAFRLEYASFEVVRSDGDLNDTPHTISCVHLKTLTLQAPSRSAFTSRFSPLAVLQHLKAPTLRKLTLGSHRPSAELGFNPLTCDVSPLLHFLAQPSRGLQSLELHYLPMTIDDLIRCLKAIPSLARLVFLPFRLSDLDVFFNRLTGDIDLLPRLVYLRTYHCPMTDAPIDENGLARMLAWRWAAVGVAQLQCFHMPRFIYRPEVIDDKAWSTFRRLEEEGMGLCLIDY